MFLDIKLLERFESVRTIGYLAVFSGIFAGPVAALVMLKPAVFLSMDLLKIVFLTASMGTPVVGILSAAMLTSEIIGSPHEKPDIEKIAPGAITMGGILALAVHAATIVFGLGGVQKYFVFLLLMTGAGVTAVIIGGIFERLGKIRRAKRDGKPSNESANKQGP